MPSKGNKSRIEKQEVWRDAIQTTLILKKVNNHILAKPKDKDYEDKKMTSTQMRGAELLLRKTMPDLKAIEGSIGVDLTVITPILPDYLKDAD